jgi:taurine transport system substrate-binding protein
MRTRRFRAIPALAAAAGLLLCGLAACGTAAPAAGHTIRVAYAAGTQADFYYALQHKLFAKYGVHVEPIKFDSGPALITALAAGSADVGYFGPPSLIAADAHGADLQVFGVANDTGDMDALYASPKSGVATAAGLRGKTVATTDSSVPDILLHIALEKAHIPFGAVKIQYLNTPAIVAGYARGDIQAAWVFNSVGAKLLSYGARMGENATDLGLSDPGDFVATKSFIGAHAAELRNFLAAVDEGARTTNASASATETVLTKGAGLNAAQAKIVAQRELGSGTLSADLAQPGNALSLMPGGGFTKLLRAEAQMMQELAIIPPTRDLSQMVTDSIVTSTGG